jgi:hypothetical protein
MGNLFLLPALLFRLCADLGHSLNSLLAGVRILGGLGFSRFALASITAVCAGRSPA